MTKQKNEYAIRFTKEDCFECWCRIEKNKWRLNWGYISRKKVFNTDSEMKMLCWDMYRNGFNVEYYENCKPWNRKNNKKEN
jgi:hypothetical protein